MKSRSFSPLLLLGLSLLLTMGCASTSQNPAVYWAVTGRQAERYTPPASLPTSRSVVVFYEYQLGRVPQITPTRSLHGGIPQNADLAGHLKKVRSDIDERLPDAGFDGLAVIDYESWHPLWDETPSSYQTASVREMLEHSPSLPIDDARRAARTAYEDAAREFMLATIRTAKEMRPEASWGFYGFPMSRDKPDRLAWLYEASDALFPVIYAPWEGVAKPDPERSQAPPKRYATLIRNTLAVARRAAGMGRQDPRPIYPFVCPRYRINVPHIGGRFLNQTDLDTLVRSAREPGVTGYVFWDNYDTTQSLEGFNRFMRDRFAPALEASGPG